MIITGYVVVRLPQLNYTVRERDVVPRVNGIYYAGIDRQRWIDVFDEDFYAKKTPANIVRMAQVLRGAGNDSTGIDICQDVNVALELLQYSNRRSVDNELLAVRSPDMNAIKGTIETDLLVEWIGFDLVGMGEWSLISAGVFMHPKYYSDWLVRLNRWGLFDNTSAFREYESAYERACEIGHSEPLAPHSAGLDRIVIEIGRVRSKTTIG